MTRLGCQLLALLSFVLASGTGTAQEKSAPKPEDVAAYLEVVGRLKEVPIDQQADLLRRFIEDHPESTFRPEAEKNLERLEELLVKTDPTRKREAKDTERYLRAVEYSKRLSPQDQIALWEQFMRENPTSIYRSDAEAKRNELRARYGEARPVPAPSTAGAMVAGQVPVATTLPLKDRQKATLLATFPGLIVPGLGHWYAKDYLLGGILSGVRVVGLAIGIPAIVNDNRPMIIVGAIAYAFSYLVDVIDAPFAVDRYNDQLETKRPSSSELIPQDPDMPLYAMSWTVHF